MGYWKAKVLPMIKKAFDKSGPKKTAAVSAEACKTFDDSKEEINKEFEEKKEELQPKVLEIYQASSAETKAVVKDRTEAGVKKESAAVNNFLEELVKIEFPGSKLVSEASSKCGPALVSGPVFFVFEKVCTFLPVEETATIKEAAVEEVEPPKASAEKNSTTQEKGVVEEKEEEPKGKGVEIAAPPPSSMEETTATTTTVLPPEVVTEPATVKAKVEVPTS